ncbi:hypothetical protein D3C81_2342170 [compost metagenome]
MYINGTMRVAKNPTICLHHEGMPSVTVGSRQMPLMLIATHLNERSMVADYN